LNQPVLSHFGFRERPHFAGLRLSSRELTVANLDASGD